MLGPERLDCNLRALSLAASLLQGCIPLLHDQTILLRQQLVFSQTCLRGFTPSEGLYTRGMQSVKMPQFLTDQQVQENTAGNACT